MQQCILMEHLIDLKLLDLDNALKDFKKAILFSPEDVLYWENLGVAYGMMGDHGMAVDSLERGIKKGVETTSIRSNLAFAYIQNNECQKAVSLLERMEYHAEKKDLNGTSKLLIDARRCLERGR